VSVVRATGGVLRLLWCQERSEIHYLVVNAVVLPAALTYIGFRLSDDPATRRAWIAGAVTLGIGLSAIANVAIPMLIDRFGGRLDLLRSLPLPKEAYLLAYLSLACLHSVAVVGALLLLLGAVGMLPSAAGLLSGVLPAAVACTLAWSAIGFALAMRAPDLDRGSALTLALGLGLGFLSPVFYAVSDLPAIVRPLAWLSPFTHFADALRAALSGAPVPTSSWAVSSLLAVVLVGSSLRLVRWHE